MGSGGTMRVQFQVADDALRDHLEQPARQPARGAVAHQPALAVGGDHPVRPQQPQGVRDGAVAHADGHSEVGDAQVTGVVQGEQDAQSVHLAQCVEHGGGVL